MVDQVEIGLSPKSAPPERHTFTGRTALIWLLGFFGVIFAANGVLIWLALGSFPGVVVESSYHAGQVYNQEIAAAEAQAARGWQVSAEITRSGETSAVIRINAQGRTGAPISGVSFTGRLLHPVYSGDDHVLTFAEREAGIFVAPVSGIRSGNWTLELEADNSSGRVFLSENRVFLSE